MKRLALGIAFLLLVSASVFAQNDLQPLAVVKLNRQETITLKQLKSRVNFLEKQYEGYGVTRKLTAEERKQVLDNLIQEKLITQAAAKEGLSVSDSQVDAAFLNTFSQQLGQQVTEAQLGEFIKAQTGQTLETYIQQNTGMNLAEYKAYLRAQLIGQQYVLAKKQAELKTVAATDEEIRQAYEMNRSNFVWNDMLKIFLVLVPKGTDSVAARATATDLRNQISKDKSKDTAIRTSQDNGKKYQAGNMLVQKTTAQAQALGWSYDKLSKLFSEAVGFVSEVSETPTDFQFYVVQKKYDAKMLGISDIIQPESTVTVYDYIRSNLTAQKQNQYFSLAAQQIARDLDTTANVERKKTGDALTTLLSW